jgi:hypothetical protein
MTAHIRHQEWCTGIDTDRFSVLTGTDSTVSDQPGHGRSMNTFLSRGGHHIDRMLRSAKHARRRRQTDHAWSRTRVLHPPMPEWTCRPVSEVAVPHGLAAVPSENSVPRIVGLDLDRFSLASGTNSTVSDQAGAGRLLGVFLSRAGAQLEHYLGWAAARAGLGPTALVVRIIRRIADAKALVVCQDMACPQRQNHHGHKDKRTRRRLRLPPSSTTNDILHTLFTVYSFPCNRCRRLFVRDFVGQEQTTKDFRKLAGYIRTAGAHQVAAIQYVAMLIAAELDFLPVLVETGALGALYEALRASFEAFWRLHLDPVAASIQQTLHLAMVRTNEWFFAVAADGLTDLVVRRRLAYTTFSKVKQFFANVHDDDLRKELIGSFMTHFVASKLTSQDTLPESGQDMQALLDEAEHALDLPFRPQDVPA